MSFETPLALSTCNQAPSISVISKAALNTRFGGSSHGEDIPLCCCLRQLYDKSSKGCRSHQVAQVEHLEDGIGREDEISHLSCRLTFSRVLLVSVTPSRKPCSSLAGSLCCWASAGTLSRARSMSSATLSRPDTNFCRTGASPQLLVHKSHS